MYNYIYIYMYVYIIYNRCIYKNKYNDCNSLGKIGNHDSANTKKLTI